MPVERDEIAQAVIKNIVRDWYEMGPSDRANALSRYPELREQGLSMSDPCDEALVAEDEEVLRQADMIDRGPFGGDESMPFSHAEKVALTNYREKSHVASFEKGMTTEDDFHALLDANPEDHHTRLVFADWLQEHDDPRAEGYRALGQLRRNSYHFKPQIGNHREDPAYIWGSSRRIRTGGTLPSRLPHDWLSAVENTHTNHGPTEDWRHHNTRQEAEDAAAHAFSQLPPNRKAELLATPKPPPPTSLHPNEKATLANYHKAVAPRPRAPRQRQSRTPPTASPTAEPDAPAPAPAKSLRDTLLSPNDPPPATESLPPAKKPQSTTRLASRLADVGRRRRILRALKAERQVTDALGAYHLPDSHAADVLVLHDAEGQPITDTKMQRHALKIRRTAVARLNDPNTPERDREQLQTVANATAHAFEVKTLQKSPRNYVQMNPKARARKLQWAADHNVPFHTVAVDLRRGKKFSGHQVYVAPNSVGPTTALAKMRRARTMNTLLDTLNEGEPVTTEQKSHRTRVLKAEPPKDQYEDEVVPDESEPTPSPEQPAYDWSAENKPFEDAIAADPTEAANRLVYADHLDEHGDHDEAAFQRSMGEWHRDHPEAYQDRFGTGSHPHRVIGVFPEGVDREHDALLPVKGSESMYGHKPVFVRAGLGLVPPVPSSLAWHKYRDMEKAFRIAFMAGRKAT